MNPNWLSERTKHCEVSGIRKAFDLGKSLKDPVNLSIGQPEFDPPKPIRDAALAAMERGDNGYTVTQGIPQLRARLLAEVRKHYNHPDRELFITSGTSGALSLALLCTVNPGDEVIFFDPYFVMYPNFVKLTGGKPVVVDTYPNFDIDVNKVAAAITPKTKVIIANSPANPTGKVYSRQTLRELAELARRHNILLISDEVYRAFCYDDDFATPAEFNEDVLVVDGFSKAYAMTGWRLGFCHGPRRLIEEMIKVQQFTFVCAPSIVQHGGVAALDCDITPIVAQYKGKRDRICQGLQERFDLVRPGGAFYLFARAPWGTGTEFVSECIRNNLLIIPGNVFSAQDTHFRLSYAASDETIDRGIEILNKVARR